MPVEYEYDRARTPVRKAPESASLAEVVDEILDKGIVIDAWVRVSLLGLELLTIEARVVVASIDTYLRYAEAIGLTPLVSSPPAQQVTSGRENGQHAGRQPPSEHEVLVGQSTYKWDWSRARFSGQRPLINSSYLRRAPLGYLFDHPEGLQLGELQLHFNTPW